MALQQEKLLCLSLGVRPYCWSVEFDHRRMISLNQPPKLIKLQLKNTKTEGKSETSSMDIAAGQKSDNISNEVRQLVQNTVSSAISSAFLLN